MIEKLKKNGFRYFITLVAVVIFGTLLFYLLIIGLFANISPDKNTNSNKHDPYPYDDYEYLGTDREDEIEQSRELGVDIERLILCACRNEPKPGLDSIIISDELYERLKYRPRELYADSSYNDDEIYISYLITKVYKDKAIISYELVYGKGAYTRTVDDSKTLPDQEYSPDKIYLSRSDGKWIVENEFKL